MDAEGERCGEKQRRRRKAGRVTWLYGVLASRLGAAVGYAVGLVTGTGVGKPVGAPVVGAAVGGVESAGGGDGSAGRGVAAAHLVALD